MRLPRSRMRRSLIASALALALCGCGSTVVRPPVADLSPAPEPMISAEALTSAAALDAYDVEHEAWGRGEHGKVVRLCRWFEAMGAKGLRCAP